MDLRTLRYFLAVAREENMSQAAKQLHVTQPTLSRQLADLEKELGRQLYVRGHAGIVPTEHGVMLANYAESIIDLAEKAEADISLPAKTVAGSVHIAAGETKAMRYLTNAMRSVRAEYPSIDFQLYSGTTADLMDGLVRGQYDFLLECDLQTHANLNLLELPDPDVWGLVVKRDDPLATRDRIRIEDVLDTLVRGFEQQQDRLFRTEAIDVEADISVLETMMASDGLVQPQGGLRAGGSRS